MTIHQCPKCELRFEHRTELDDHCWHDHPEFRHAYPAVHPPPPPPGPSEEHDAPAAPAHEHVKLGDSLMRWLVPRQRHD